MARAADSNAAFPARGFRAHFESEIAVNKALPNRVEGISSVEQFAGTLTWNADSGDQHSLGYRIVTTGLPLPAGYVLGTAWIVPSLYGDRFTLLSDPKQAAKQGESEADSLSTRAKYVVHPLASDRDRYYTYARGDTVEVVDAVGQSRRVVVVEVTPHQSFPEATRVFTGQIYLEVGTGALMRMRGQIYTIRPPGKPLKGLKKVGNALVASASIIDFQNTRINGVLMPTYQSGDLAILLPLTTAMGTMVRMVTRLHDVDIAAGAPIQLGANALPPTVARTQTTKDSLNAFKGWENSPTDWPSRYLINDRLDVGPPRYRPTGDPVVFVRSPTMYDFFRFNRVEGIYLGAAGTLFLRDKFPGLAIRGGVGYGFWDQTVKGGVVATLRRGPWLAEATAEHGFGDRHQVQGSARLRDGHAAALRAGPLRLCRPGRRPDRHRACTRAASQWNHPRRLRRGAGSEHAAGTEARPLGQNYYGNPLVDPGTYFRSRLSLIWREDISSHFARPGIGAQVYLENGQGDFQYTSVNARLVGRANAAGLVFSFVGYGGIATAPTMLPTQRSS